VGLLIRGTCGCDELQWHEMMLLIDDAVNQKMKGNLPVHLRVHDNGGQKVFMSFNAYFCSEGIIVLVFDMSSVSVCTSQLCNSLAISEIF
jgi:pyruvate carboxylase